MRCAVSVVAFGAARSRGAARRVVSTVRDVSPYEPRFFSVTCGASGSSDAGTEATVRWLQELTDAPLAAHMTCIGASRAALAEQARRYWHMGVRHLVALRGDPPAGEDEYRPHPDGYASAAELVMALREIAPFDISVAGYPETHPDAPSPRAELEYLKRKVEAGANRVITQVCFDNPQFLRFRDQARAMGIDVPIVAGILPIVDFNKVARFCRACGASLPDWLVRRFADLDRDGDETARRGAATAAAQCLDLRAEGVDVGGVLRRVEADLHVALGGEVVDLVGPYFLHNPDQIRRIRHVPVMQEEAHFLMMRILVEMIDPVGVELAGPPLDTVDFVAFLE